MVLLLYLCACLPNGGEEQAFLAVGDHLWVGYGMARGYDLPFGERLTVRKVRVLFMKESRIYFEGYPQRYYLRTDFADDYAFREDPRKKYDFSEAQWEMIRKGEIRIGMSMTMFLLIWPRSQEIELSADGNGPIEQWLYREKPIELYGTRELNPPTHLFFFQKGTLVATM